MSDYLISMFIDNELDLDEKIDFVEEVHRDEGFKDQAVELLEQEKQLRDDFVVTAPVCALPAIPRGKLNIFKFWIPACGGFATAAVLLLAIFLLQPAAVKNIENVHRFVIYQPDATRADIIGSFTDWKPVAMKKIGDTGYWSISIDLPEGEYRYSYLLGNGRRIADPTVLSREQDDFGGENSIIRVAAEI